MSDPTVLSLEVRVVEIFSPLGRILVSLSSCLQNLSFLLNEVMLEVAFWEDLAAAHKGIQEPPLPPTRVFIWDPKNQRAAGPL